MCVCVEVDEGGEGNNQQPGTDIARSLFESCTNPGRTNWNGRFRNKSLTTRFYSFFDVPHPSIGNTPKNEAAVPVVIFVVLSQMHSSRILMVPGVTLLLIVGERLTTAWVPFQHQPRRPAAVVVARAKPPPAAQFDLAAIEAFESQLDAQEKEEAGLLDEDDIDSDWNIKDTEVIWTVDDATSGRRLDAALVALAAKHAEYKDYGRTNNIDNNDSNAATLTRTMAGSWITEGRVKVDGALVTRKSLSVATGQMLTIQWPAPQQDHQRIIAQDLALDILYEDEVMIVLNKAPGMVVHPAVGHWDGTVVNALAYYLAHRSPYGPGEFAVDDELDATRDTGSTREYDYWRPGVVHRLDKGTTGVLVFAKTRAALSQLSAAFADRKVKKTYLAISIGNPGTNVRIDKPIGRHPIHRQRMRVVPNPHKHGALPESAMPTSTSGRNALSFVDTLAFDGRLR